MLHRARQTVSWSATDANAEQKRRHCQVCEHNTPSHPAEILLSTQAPEYPFQQAVAEHFQLEGHVYLAFADRLTGWLEVEHLPNGVTSVKFVSTFRRWCIPESLACNGGTSPVSEETGAFFGAAFSLCLLS